MTATAVGEVCQSCHGEWAPSRNFAKPYTEQDKRDCEAFMEEIRNRWGC